LYNYFWRRFREYGWEFSVVANELQRESERRPEFPFTRLPLRFGLYRRHVRHVAPDAVILFLHLKDVLVWPLIHWLKWNQIPVAMWTKGRNLDDPDNRVRNACFAYTHRLSDALILYAADGIRFVAAQDRHKVFVANNTLNFDDFPNVNETREEIKRALGIPFRKVVLFAGRIGEEKNRKKVDHLIEIFRDLQRADVGLVIVGSGLDDSLRSRVNPANTRYLGEVHDPTNSQISRLFSMADVCAIPGHVGLGLNQAFYFGLPVITEEGRQPPEIGYLEDGRNGFIVPEGDVGALRDRILFLVDNDAERKRLAANARFDILSKASTEGMFQGFLSCTEFLANRSGVSRPQNAC
jgi:glycosyltransferase involved in cell wall biosynthesis